VKDIRRKTRKQHLSEDKIRIVLVGLGGENTIVELCRSLPGRRLQRKCR
jgi:transposase